MFYLGNIYTQTDEFDKMVETMEEVLKINPNHSQALNHLAYSLADKGLQIEKSYKMAKKALLLEPESAYILDTVGWILYKKGEYTKAQTYLEKAVNKEPKEALILEHLGDVYVRLKKFQKAIDIYKKALLIEVDDERKKIIEAKLSTSLSKAESFRKPASKNPE